MGHDMNNVQLSSDEQIAIVDIIADRIKMLILPENYHDRNVGDIAFFVDLLTRFIVQNPSLNDEEMREVAYLIETCSETCDASRLLTLSRIVSKCCMTVMH